jgi:glycosyltransferase involved in cell wall biosynthesis
MVSRRLRALFVVNTDRFFLSHRLPLALALQKSGFEVTVAAAATGEADTIRGYGLDFAAIPLSRYGMNPLRELWTAMTLARLCRRLRPDLVHLVTMKPIVYGAISVYSYCRPAIVNAITGLGSTFGEGRRASIRRAILLPLLRAALATPRSKTILQNPDDVERLVREDVVSCDKVVLIRGSGVDCSRFRPTDRGEGDPLVVLASRMLWDKGVADFVDAARLVRSRNPRARFVLMGRIDLECPAGIPRAQLEEWADEGAVEWWGYKDDMFAVLPSATVVVLPTVYPEGVPKILLEAAACGCPIVATDVPGCREIVRHDVNGLLVTPHDVGALAGAIQAVIDSPQLQKRYGEAGRSIAVSEFSVEYVVEQTMAIYRTLLGTCWPAESR